MKMLCNGINSAFASASDVIGCQLNSYDRDHIAFNMLLPCFPNIDNNLGINAITEFKLFRTKNERLKHDDT